MQFLSGSIQNSGTSGKKRDCPAKSGMGGRFVDRRDQVNVCVFSLTEMVHRREASCLLGIRVLLHSSLPHRRDAELRPQVHDTDRPARLRLPGKRSHWYSHLQVALNISTGEFLCYVTLFSGNFTPSVMLLTLDLCEADLR